MKTSAVLLALLLAGCPSQEDASASSAELPKLKARVDSFAARLRAMRDKTPAPRDDLGDEPCPDEKIEASTKGAPAPLLIADFDYLARYARPELEPYAGAAAEWKLLTAPALLPVLPAARVSDVKTANEVLFVIKKLDDEYDWIGVVRTSERRMPRREGDKFHAGRLLAELVVFELETGTPVCRARVEAESSTEVAGRSGSDPEQTLRNDFAAQVRNAIGDAVRGVSRLLREDLG